MFFFPNPRLVIDVEKRERDNEHGPKAKKRKAVFPKKGPSTGEENEESVNLRGMKVHQLVDLICKSGQGG